MQKLLTASLLLASCATHLAIAQKISIIRQDNAGNGPIRNEQDDKVYTYVQYMPQLLGGGGQAAIVAAIQHNFQYPVNEALTQVKGRAFARFTVTKTGSISAIAIVKGLSPAIDTAIVRAIQLLPPFTPGYQNDRAVPVSFTLPVNIKLTTSVTSSSPPEEASVKLSPSPIAGHNHYSIEPHLPAAAPSANHGAAMSGWRFDNTPIAEALDDTTGSIRFKISINADGEVESVTKVSGDVSPAQEKICRDKLLDATLIKTTPTAGATTGFYTFRFSVR